MRCGVTHLNANERLTVPPRRLSAQERLKDDQEKGLFAAPEYTPATSSSSVASSSATPYRSPSIPSPSVPYRSPSVPAVPYTPAPTAHSRSLSTSSAFRPTISSSASSRRSSRDGESIFTRGEGAGTTGSVTSVATSQRSIGSASTATRERKDKIPVGSIVFTCKEPFDPQKDLMDPVLASGAFCQGAVCGDGELTCSASNRWADSRPLDADRGDPQKHPVRRARIVPTHSTDSCLRIVTQPRCVARSSPPSLTPR